MIKPDGEPFSSEEIAVLAAKLDALSDEDRVQARNENSAAIAAHDAPKMLVVSGPGTGKSSLFKARLKHWLERHPDQSAAPSIAQNSNSQTATPTRAKNTSRMRGTQRW